MNIQDTDISRNIIRSYFRKLESIIDVDVAIVGAGPSGLVAGTLLAEAGHHVAIFEKRIAPGGGIWGGGMLFNDVVLESNVLDILDHFRIGYHRSDLDESCLVDAIELAAGLIFGAIQAGVRLMNGINVEDIVVRENRVAGLVINWTSVETNRLHVDPLSISARFTLDASGHECSVVHMVQKHNLNLRTPTGRIMGEGPMSAAMAEELVVRNTTEIHPGLYVMGMAASATMGSQRMGPIFGGMLLSGQKAAREIMDRLKRATDGPESPE